MLRDEKLRLLKVFEYTFGIEKLKPLKSVECLALKVVECLMPLIVSHLIMRFDRWPLPIT